MKKKRNKEENKFQVTITVSYAVSQEIQHRRKQVDGNASWVFERDLNRYYSSLDNHRPKILSLFDLETLEELNSLLDPLKGSLRHMGSSLLKPLIVDLAQKNGIAPSTIESVKKLTSDEVLTLVDTVECLEREHLGQVSQ